MWKNWRSWSGFLGVMLLLASCTPTAHIEKDDNTDFTNFKTFAWIEKSEKGNNRSNDLAEQKIRDAVTKELQKTTGWKESKRNPDVLLSYDLLVERSVRQESDPRYSQSFSRLYYNPYSRRAFSVYYPSRFMGYDNYSVPVREGTVTVTMTDARTDKAIWQGWTTSEINSRNLSSKEIQNSVKAIFRKFDVASR